MIYFLFRSSSVVEQSAVNRSVVGSSPTCGAITYTALILAGASKLTSEDAKDIALKI
jgi:hypothetical protein